MNLKTNTSTTLNPIGYTIYRVFIVVMLLLLLIRGNQSLWEQLSVIGLGDAGNHISNFALSGMLVIAIGASRLSKQIFWKSILIWAFGLILFNFIVEILITFINTRDIIDALFGIVGVIIGLLILQLIRVYGLKNK